MNQKTLEDATILLEEIKGAVARGTKHYNSAGRLLRTPKEIIQTLIDEGQITFEPLRPHGAVLDSGDIIEIDTQEALRRR